MAQLLTALGTEASSKAVISFGELYERLITTAGSDNFDQFMAMYDTTTDAGRAELKAFLENDKSFLEDPLSTNSNGGGFPTPSTAGPAPLTTIPVNTILSRVGETDGLYVAIDKSSTSPTPFFARSLKDSQNYNLRVYKVLIPFDANVGRTASWFNKAGGAKEAALQNRISYLLGNNPSNTQYIEDITGQ